MDIKLDTNKMNFLVKKMRLNPIATVFQLSSHLVGAISHHLTAIFRKRYQKDIRFLRYLKIDSKHVICRNNV